MSMQVTSSEVTRVLDGVNKCIAKQHALAIYWVLTLLTVSMSTFSFVFQVARYIKIFADTTSDVRNWPAFWQEGVEFELSSSMKYKIPHFWFFFGLLNLLFCIVFYLLGKRMVNTVVRIRAFVTDHLNQPTSNLFHLHNCRFAKRYPSFFTVSQRNL